MACDGAKERRDGLIADMIQVREALHPGAVASFLDSLPLIITSDPMSMTTVFAGYVCTTLDRVAAAVIALAGPCCDDCDEKPPQSSVPPVMPPQGWENPDHDIMADLREAHDGLLADRDGGPDE